MSQAPDLSPRLVRQLEGRCCYGACPDPALSGSDYCAPHDAHEKGRDAAKKKRRRQRLADAGLCMEGCGRKVGKRKPKRGAPIAMRRCLPCAKEDKQRSADLRRVPVGDHRVPVAGEISPSIKLEIGRDGATRTRQVFRRGQSGKTKEETRRGHMRIADGIARLLAVWRANYTAEMDDLIASMPRIQAAEAKSRRADPLAQISRDAALLVEETCPTRGEACVTCGRAHEEDEA